MENENLKQYYLTTKDKNGQYIIYESKNFKFSEIDIINLIKILLIQKRNKDMGERILEIYRDSTDHRDEITQKRLDMIGLKNGRKPRPERINKEDAEEK